VRAKLGASAPPRGGGIKWSGRDQDGHRLQLKLRKNRGTVLASFQSDGQQVVQVNMAAFSSEADMITWFTPWLESYAKGKVTKQDIESAKAKLTKAGRALLKRPSGACQAGSIKSAKCSGGAGPHIQRQQPRNPNRLRTGRLNSNFFTTQ